VFYRVVPGDEADLAVVVQISNLPKYIHPLLTRMLKNTPYQTLINAYPHNTELLEEVLDKERLLFNTVHPFLVLVLC
jgi:hypothetical protein